MERINLNQDIKPLSEFRANATACLKQVHDTKRPIVITQHGKSSAVLMDVHEYEALLEKLELLQDIKLAETQLSNNQGITHDQVKKQILEKPKDSKENFELTRDIIILSSMRTMATLLLSKILRYLTSLF